MLKLLEQAGWKARQIGRSGDQGADVLAEKGNVSAVLQCKLWNQPVGNTAVQEVVAAKKLYSASTAFVVSNQPFTVSAKILAAANHVHLLHHNDLASLDSFLHDAKLS
jgi:restriction system protein